MKLQAHETNYGTRIDYILVTKGLLPWISHGDIQPSLKGSDHCPIYIDLHDEITLESGETLSLRDAMKQTPDLKEPPRIAAKFWNEFSGKQTVLSAFFGSHAASKQKDDITPSSTPTPTPGHAVSHASSRSLTLSASSDPTPSMSPPTTQPASCSPPPAPPKRFKPPQTTRPSPAVPAAHKRKSSENASSGTNTKKRKQQTKGQASIATFFSSKPSASSSSKKKPVPAEVIEVDDDPPAAAGTTDADQDQLDADYRLALALSEHPEPSSQPPPSSQSSQSQNKAAWSNLLAPVPPPNCTVHNEPARLYTVNKQGPNKGKTFYICSRPVGPGYDKGRDERLREEVDHRYRCNYFKWASEVRKEAMRERERERTRSGGS